MAQRTKALVLATVLLAPALSACEEEPDHDCVALEGVPATLEIGGTQNPFGSPAFVKVEDGGDFDVVVGPGGLSMMVTSIRTTGIYPGAADGREHPNDPQIVIGLNLDGELIGGTHVSHNGSSIEDPPRLGLTVTSQGAERVGVWAVFGDYALDIHDQIVNISGAITDKCGNLAIDQLSVVAKQQ